MVRRRPTAGDWLKGAGRSIRAGTAMNPLATQRFINEAHDERVAQSRGGDYHSRLRKSGSIDIFIGPDGRTTNVRPHVHVIHSPEEGRIVFTVTQKRGEHTHTEYLPESASGNEVNAVVDRLRRHLRP